MFQGFYNLASNMITQNRNLNVISNNMANVSTPGYKSDKIIESTFREELIYRYDQAGRTPVGNVSWVDTEAERVTNYTEGGLRGTERLLDVAIGGRGFFAIQTDNGVVYSRDGSFNLDNQGYLTLSGIGRVLGNNGPIRLTTDKVSIDSQGNIMSEDGFQNFGRIQVVDFADYSQLTKITGGVFRSAAAGQNVQDPQIKQAYLEDSNVSMIDEMTAMMSGQRALQSSSQLFRMYDQLTGKIVQLGSM